MSRITAVVEWILRLPLIWGGVACLAFYAVVAQGWFDDALMRQGWTTTPIVQRYFAGHVVEYATTTLFFVGIAALVMLLINQRRQFQSLQQVVLDPIPAERQKISECGPLLRQLQDLPERFQQTLLVRRLWDAIAYVRRKESAEDLDDHLRYLENVDAVRMDSGYAMVRIIVWAIPILGFLGTVIGITMAIANMSPQEFERSIPEVIGGLSVAFDTTALALALSMVLMFSKHCLERLDDRLMTAVDARVSGELVGRFEEREGDSDANVAVVRRMSEQVLETVEALAERQANVLKSAINETHQQWTEVSVAAGKIVKTSLSESLNESLTTTLSASLDRHARVLSEGALEHADRLNSNTAKHVEQLDKSAQDTVGRLRDGLEKLAELLVESLQRHGEVLSISEKELAEENRRHLSEVEAALGEAMVVAADRQEQLIKQSENLLKEMQIALVEAAGATVRQQEQLIRQGDVLLQVVDATGQITKLESSLNDNLGTLKQGYHFEEMTLNLSAAIQLLCARLGHLPASGRGLPVEDDRPARSAA